MSYDGARQLKNLPSVSLTEYPYAAEQIVTLDAHCDRLRILVLRTPQGGDPRNYEIYLQPATCAVLRSYLDEALRG